jgi:hypothetical protein
MSAQGISIAIGADTTGLSQGFITAKSLTQEFAETINAIGAQMANVFATAGAASRGQGDAARAAAEARREQAAQEVAFERNAVQQIAEIRRSNLATDLEIARIGLEAEKQSLDEQLATHQITAERKYEILKELTEREAALNEETERSDEQSQDATLARRVEDINKIKEMQARLNLDLAALDRERTRDAQQENQKQLQSWQGVVGEITNAESSLVSDILSKRQSLAVDLGQIGLRLAESEIANDLRYYSSHLMYNALGLASDTATERGGLLVHLLSEQQKATATTASQAQQTAAVNAGAAAQQAAQASAQTAGMGTSIALGSAQIGNDAAKAAAGTYAAIAEIPLVGPFLAPPAAAAAFAAVMAYDTLTSAEGGQWQVPGREQLTMLHRNEMVLPAHLADGVRGAVAGRGGASDAVGDVHLHYGPTIHSQDSKNLDDMLRDQGSTMLAWVNARIRDRSLRLG